MEIKNALNKLDPYIIRLDKEKPAQEAGRQPSGAERSAGAGDTVDIKSPGLKSAVMEAAQAAPEIRQDRVEAVKARIADGTYEVNSRAIAAAMLQAGRDLFQ